MQSKHNKQLVPLARQLRKNMTKEERHLWYDFLRSYSVRFSRQKVLGKYIADFYSTDPSTMRMGTSKKIQIVQPFWNVMGLPLFASPITKSTAISVEFVSISMPR